MEEINEGFWVFVSHSTKDFEKVRLVRNALEDEGFRPILFYLKSVKDEEEINSLLKREIDARRRFILCDSPNAQSSKFVQSEVDYIRSQKRMYEVIDLSHIDIEKDSVKDDIMKLIKPFLKRTKVFLSFAKDSRALAYEVKKRLVEAGFVVRDSDSVYYEAVEGMHGAEASAWYAQDLDRLTKIFIESYVQTTLKDGYVLCLLSNDSGKFTNYQYVEIENALKINPRGILPILVDDKLNLDRIPELMKRLNMQKLSDEESDKEKAKVIVNTLIDFDLKNNE